MINKVEKAIKNFSMLSKNEKVLVGLSGGADSVALMLALIELGYKVFACHINHQLRGDESDRDESFCRKLCKDNEIELFAEKIDVNTFCKENKVGTEEGARILRYQVFSKYSQGAKIATAHTNSDNLETVLINMSRGTSLPGLCGIPPIRDNIIRPLIYCSRQEIEEYLKEKNQEYVTDSTNLSCDYTRNKIRHNVIPELAKINPAILKAFSKMIEGINLDNNYLNNLAENAFTDIQINSNTFSSRLLMEMDIAISKRCIALILKSLDLECSSDRIADIYNICKNDGKINVSGNVYAVSKSGKLKISAIDKGLNNDFCFEADFEQTYFIKDKSLTFYQQNIKAYANRANVNRMLANISFDYDKIQGKAIVRNRRDGDKIKFMNNPHTTKIKTLFNSDIPQEKRDDIILLADEEGVIFVEGYRIAERVRVDSNTTSVVTVSIF